MPGNSAMPLLELPSLIETVDKRPGPGGLLQKKVPELGLCFSDCCVSTNDIRKEGSHSNARGSSVVVFAGVIVTAGFLGKRG